MERPKKTKEKILIESMKLFSVEGYDAVSIRTIADAVGVGNSALYKHYKSKQDIFDAIVERCRSHFLEKASAIQDRMVALDETPDREELEKLIEDTKQICLSMYEFQTENEWIVMFRRILLMEQFKNPKMGEVYRSFFIEMPQKGLTRLFQVLMEEGYMKKKEPEVLSMEIYAPFFLYHLDSGDKEKRKELFKKHLDYFFEENL